MRKSVITRILCFCLAVLFIIPLAAFTKNPNSKVSRGNTKTALLLDDGAMTQEEFIEEVYASIDEEDLLIPEEDAYNIAKLFIQDSIVVDDFISWNEDTEIANTVVMYDETGTDTITGYTFELKTNNENNGYIVIGAYLDLPNIISEYSDDASPLYSELDLDENDQVVYVGALNYLKESEGNEEALEDINGTDVPREDVINEFDESRDISNVPQNVAIAISAELNESYFTEAELSEKLDSSSSIVALSTTPGSDRAINDPIAHANGWYAGPFKCVDYSNNWETWVESYKITDWFPGYNGCCGPTAITHLIKLYGNRYGVGAIKNLTVKQIFEKVANIGTSNGYYYNWELINGTINFIAGSYIYDCFKYFGVNTSINGRYDINYSNVKTSLTNNRLLYVMLKGHDYYGNHAVGCYAYTRLQSSSTGWYKTYIKVIDGWVTGARRYIDLASVTDTSNKYWEICF